MPQGEDTNNCRWVAGKIRSLLQAVKTSKGEDKDYHHYFKKFITTDFLLVGGYCVKLHNDFKILKNSGHLTVGLGREWLSGAAKNTL